MTLDIVQLGNEGFKIQVAVKNADGTAKNLSGATGLKIKAKSWRDETGKMFPAVLDTDGLDGIISYTVVTGDIDAIGVWTAQAYYEKSGFKGHTEEVEAFEVRRIVPSA